MNQGQGAFSPEERFRAGTGLSDLAPVNAGLGVQSLAGTSGLVAGQFDGNLATDLVVINSGTFNFTLLSGDGNGGFLNPRESPTSSTGTPAPSAIVTADFNGDGISDLAILSTESDSISIYLGDGHGGFTPMPTLNAGNAPTGISVADVTRPGGGGPDGVQDLLVGNQYGDLLILPGNGDGTFSEYRRADQRVSLAVAPSLTNGQNTFFFSDQGNDQLAYKSATAGTALVAGPAVYQDRSTGVLAPGPEQVVTVNGVQYLIVVNSGANDLLIYQLGSDGQPILASKQTFATGTDPVSLTITDPSNDLNGDDIPDLLTANQGSNDVSVFLGQLTTQGTWTLSSRPRQSSGGIGPTSVAVTNATGAAGLGANLLVSNGASNTVNVLTSQGSGFFTTGSASFPTGNDPTQVGIDGPILFTVNAGSNDVTVIDNFAGATPTISTVSTGGTDPVTAVTVDFNGDGVNDLLVANASGALDLLQGTGGGFDAPELLDQSSSPIADIALVSEGGNQLEVYATVPGTLPGEEYATLLTLGVGASPAGPGGPGSGPGQGPGSGSGQTENFSMPAETVVTLPGFPEGFEIPFGTAGDENVEIMASLPFILIGLTAVPRVSADDNGSEEEPDGPNGPKLQLGTASGILQQNLDESDDDFMPSPKVPDGGNPMNQTAPPSAEEAELGLGWPANDTMLERANVRRHLAHFNRRGIRSALAQQHCASAIAVGGIHGH